MTTPDALDAAARLTFVAGSPTDEEVAVLTAVVMAAAAEIPASPTPEELPPRSMWACPAHVRGARPRSWAESRLPR